MSTPEDHSFSASFLSELHSLGVETVAADSLEQRYSEEASAELDRQAVFGDRRVSALSEKIRNGELELLKLRNALSNVAERDIREGLEVSIRRKTALVRTAREQYARMIQTNQERARILRGVAATSVRFDDALASARQLNHPALSAGVHAAAPPPKRRKIEISEEDDFVDIDGFADDNQSLLPQTSVAILPEQDVEGDYLDSGIDDVGGYGARNDDAEGAADGDLPSQEADDFDDNEFRRRLLSIPAQESKTALTSSLSMRASLLQQLFDHQQICVRWLWELHQQRCGGIIGDEMGLGKTLEIVAFLDALYGSGLVPQQRPSLVVCPATVLRQWVHEWHRWAPSVRVLACHSSFAGRVDLPSVIKKCIQSSKTAPTIVVTTYEMVRTQPGLLVSGHAVPSWFYVVLDEGHKLRNPSARITTICKQFETPHRVLLTGAPIQNNLTELWSLFDFIFPGKLGTQEMFDSQFALPILRGGYSNASTFEARMAYKCAVLLRDLIKPFLLRRLKKDVRIELPDKNEQVLFCRLTETQRSEYHKFLESKEAKLVFSGKKNMLFGVDVLRKICNHTFLLQADKGSQLLAELQSPEVDVTSIPMALTACSSKLKVVMHILRLWWDEGTHKVLLFAQTRQMLDIVEVFVKHSGYPYLRMDGSSAIQRRASLIDEFNNSASRESFIFLLTTRVGGLGVNLTAANKVLIFDPDWNPVTDLQARERSYRIGQTRSVTIYRLVTLGTIEEKIYQRQIFKQFLTNRILTNPSQAKSLFKSSDLRELFRFTDSEQFTVPDASMDPESAKAALSAASAPLPSDPANPAGEDSILHDLLGDSLHSRLDHEKLVGDSEGSDPALNLEAERMATAAVARLRESRSAPNLAEKVVSWSGAGRFGKVSGRSSPAPSRSQSVLSETKIAAQVSLSTLDQDRLLRDLHAYLESRGGAVTSSALVAAFSDRVAGPDTLRLFKSLLTQVADLDKSAGTWTLRSEI